MKMVNNTKVIIFNGPPMSGKDLFTDYLESYISKNSNTIIEKVSFKQKIINFVLDYYQIDINEWENRYNNRKLKEAKWDKLNGLSQREALIDMSERKIKPILGKDFFGKCVANSIDKHPLIDKYYISSDGGFREEIQPIINKIGEDNIIIFRLHRKGYDFSGDSRGLIKDEWFPGVRMYDIKSGDHQETLKEIVNYLFA